jgi:hypothetical protein
MTRLGLLTVLIGSVALAQTRDVHAALEWQILLPSSERAPRLRTDVTGWTLTGSNVDAYQIRCDDMISSCDVPILRTKLGAKEPLGVGSLTHVESAVPWRGHRLRLRAELRTGRVEGWAALWMRIDGADGRVLAFDNMQDRSLRGTTSYTSTTVVLEVPPDAVQLGFGVLLHGPGAVFIRELVFEEVTRDVATTDLIAPIKAAVARDGKTGTGG